MLRTKIKITAKFRASRRLRFEDLKRIMSTEMRSKSFGPQVKNPAVNAKISRRCKISHAKPGVHALISKPLC